MDAALDLPPLADQPAATLHLLAALAALSDSVYSATVAEVGRELPIEIESSPASTSSGATATARLLHFRPAGGHGSHHSHHRQHPRSPLDDLGSDDGEEEEDLESPQQWGLWRLRLPDGGNGGGGGGSGDVLECLVVAFRGTASPADVLIDAAIAPEALAPRGAYSNSEEGNANESSSSSSDDDEDDEREERDAAKKKNKRKGSAPPPPPPRLHAHHGFLTGARRHLRSILRLLSCHGGARGIEGNGNGKNPLSSSSFDFSVPVFFTGHSLGGGYAAAAALDLLSSGAAKRVFGAASVGAAGAEARHQQQRRRRRTTPSAAAAAASPSPSFLLRGGVVTFGAPPVFHCPPGNTEAAHARLDELMEAAGLAAKKKTENESENESDGEGPSSNTLVPRFSFTNVITAGDPVPRLLGTGFSGVARLVATAVPSIDAVRASAEAYRPLGTLLFDISGAAGALAGPSGTATATTGTAISAVVAARLASAGFAGLRLAGAPMPLRRKKKRESLSSPQQRRRRTTAAAAAAASSLPRCFHALGDEADSDAAAAHLSGSRPWAAASAAAAIARARSEHSLEAYRGALRRHCEAATAAAGRGAAASAAPRAAPAAAATAAAEENTFFSSLLSTPESRAAAAALGRAGAVASAALRAAAVARAADVWHAYARSRDRGRREARAREEAEEREGIGRASELRPAAI